MKETIRELFLFLIGGFIYISIEIVFKQTHSSHWSMFLCGGLVFLCVGLINEVYTYDMSLLLQAFVGALFIATPLEFVFGLLFNRDYSIWDYRKLPGTIHILNDQVNLLFCLLWIVLCGVGVVIDDFIRWKFFGEEKPHYKWI